MQNRNIMINRSAASGFARGAEAYVDGRPGYPNEADRWLRDVMGLSAERSALDLGAGTGKFTNRLVETGACVSAVEPVEAMRARLVRDLPDVNALPGTAEDIPFDDDSFDAVVCAQSFHWFASSEALSEIHRVLKPDGKLGLIWNLRDERIAWVAALSEIVRPYQGNTPRFHEGHWRRVFPARGFGPLSETRFDHTHVGPPENVILQRILSVSFIAALPGSEQEKIADAVRKVISNCQSLAGKNEVAFPYTTITLHCSKV